MAAFSLRNPGTGTTHNSATSIQPLHLCGLTRQSERTTRTRRQTVLCLPLKEENGNFALCAYGAWASLFWFEYCGVRRMLASDSTIFARFFGGSASRRIRGSHHIFNRDGVDEILNLQPRGSMAKPYQVKQVRRVLVQYKLAEEGQ
jgi:hypothetical protein